MIVTVEYNLKFQTELIHAESLQINTNVMCFSHPKKKSFSGYEYPKYKIK